MSQMKCMESSIVLNPEDVCEREEWIMPGRILSRDTLDQPRIQVGGGEHEASCFLDQNEGKCS